MHDPIHDRPEESRFVLELGASIAFVRYRREGDDGGVLVLTHAEVPAELEGRGVGSRLVAAVLALVRERGERVVPVCPFIARCMQRHAETADLLAARPPRD